MRACLTTFLFFMVSTMLAPATSGAVIEDVSELVTAVGGADIDASSNAEDRLKLLPTALVVPATLHALASLPDERNPQLVYGNPANRLVSVLNDAERRSDKAAFDRMLVNAWPRAKNRVTKFVLLFRYGTRGIVDGKPMALATLRDPKEGLWLREQAAAALVRLGWPEHRDEILAALDAQADAGEQILLALMDPAVQREPDAVVIALAAERVKSWAGDRSKASRAADLANWLGTYSREHHGVPLALPENVGSVERAVNPRVAGKASVQRCLDWWEKNRDRFEPQLKAARARWREQATTNPTAVPQAKD